MKTFVQLGAYGDLVCMLPVFYEAARTQKVRVVVSRDYADLFDGITYADAVVFNGHYSKLPDGVSYAKRLDPRAVVTQVWDGTRTHRTTDNYQRDMWKRAGAEHRWEQCCPVFDRRDEGHERALLERVDNGKPMVLFAGLGKSSPFDKANDLLTRLSREFRDHNVVDLATVQCDRIYDLLGLMDAAECLVTIDTAHMHLAHATSIPVVGLTNNQPWLATARRANHLLHQPYERYDHSEVVGAVHRVRPFNGPILHLWSHYDMNADDLARHQRAAETFPWINLPVSSKSLPRDARSIGEKKDVPFVKDLIDHGVEKVGRGAVVLTNSDVGLVPETDKRLRRLLGCRGAVYGYRYNHASVDAMSYHRNITGAWDGGLDLFAFTTEFWKKHRDKFPDMVLGRQLWDLQFRDLIKMLGGGELYGCVWHKEHDPYWRQHRTTPGNRHNESLYRRFKETNDRTRPWTSFTR